MQSAIKDIWDSLIRTVSPLIVGYVVSFFTTRGIEVDPALAAAVGAGVGAVAAGVWYTLVRVFEVYVSPKFGWLLGLAKTPEYPAKPQG